MSDHPLRVRWVGPGDAGLVAGLDAGLDDDFDAGLVAGLVAGLDADFDADLVAGVRRVVLAVVDLGGAVGWPDGVTPEEVDAWWADRLADVAAGRARVAVVADLDGVVQALGRWVWNTPPIQKHNATVSQVMVHPDARGRGLARLLMEALIADARRAGVESLVLDVRGNNHAAERLYRSLGFLECGVTHDLLAVGDHRFDAVEYQLPLGLPDGVIRHGRRAEGPGASQP